MMFYHKIRIRIMITLVCILFRNFSVNSILSELSSNNTAGNLPVNFVDGNLGITLDGFLTENHWNQTPLWGITPTGQIRLGTNFIMEIKGIYNLTHVAFAFRWNDTTINPYKNQWLFNESKWVNLHQQEDTLGVVLKMADFDLSHGADFWYWHAALTDPLAYADDLYFRAHMLDINNSYITNEWYFPDANESQGFIENSYNLQTGNTGSYNESDHPYWYANGSVINETDIYEFDTNDTLPGYILTPDNGSRRDMQAKGRFDSNTGWTVEFLRRGLTEPIEVSERYDIGLEGGGRIAWFRIFVEDGLQKDQRFWGGNSTPFVDSFLFSPHHPTDTWTSTTSSVDISDSTSISLGFNGWFFLINIIFLTFGIQRSYKKNERMI